MCSVPLHERFSFVKTGVQFVPVDAIDRLRVNAFIASRWLDTVMVIRGKAVDMTRVEGIVAMEADELVGLVTYVVHDDVLEITSLDAVAQGQGIGTALLTKVIQLAHERGCAKVIVVTTNDNIQAIRFYQKQGFDMARLYHNSILQARMLKPQIPMLGEEGIPLKHEIEFEMFI